MREGFVFNEVISSKVCKLKVIILLLVILRLEICYLSFVRFFLIEINKRMS